MRGSPHSFPLSLAQKRLWFLERLHPDTGAHTVPTAFRLAGALDVAALEQGLNEILRRHDVLRTAFREVNGRPVPVVAPALTLCLPVIDLRELPESQREVEALRRLGEEARQPVDLSRAPLLRAALLRLDEEEQLLLLLMHRIVADDDSLSLLLQELQLLYELFSARTAADAGTGTTLPAVPRRGWTHPRPGPTPFVGGRSVGGSMPPSPLPPLPRPYSEHAARQYRWLQSEASRGQLAYWKQQLESAPALLELPLARPRPRLQSFHGAAERVTFPAPLAHALKALSQQEGVSLFVTLLSAFQTLLYRYARQDDIVVGTPVPRRCSETAALIGPFANTLALRARVSGCLPFRELLARNCRTVREALAHQELPFEKLLEELQLKRELSYPPLFQMMFMLRERSPALDLAGLTVSPVPVDTGTTQYDLTLSITDEKHGLTASLEYNMDLFDAAPIARMLGQFQVMLEGIAADPGSALAHLPMLTDHERQQLLIEWNETRTDEPPHRCVHQLFEAQVERTPEAPAVICDGVTLTYRELDRRANQLAHYLQRLQVGPDVPVAICLERSLEMVTAVLAVLKAGGAYVPLDPAYPKERLAFMLEDTRAPVVLTQQKLLQELPPHQAQVISLDTEWERIAGRGPEKGSSCPQSAIRSRSNPKSKIRNPKSDHLAYVIYTSGSTGKPKGVAMGHRPLANLLAWQLRNFAHPEPARVLQFAPLSFDVSFQELFSTWATGGTLVLVREELRRDVGGLLQFLTKEAIERLFLPFVALQQLAEAIDRLGPAPLSLRELITAGEQLQITAQITRLFEKLPHCSLHNQYGPSETHVVTAFTLAGAPESWPTLPPIGRPIANTQIFLLDEALQPVPIGVPGELYIGGHSLARGYLHRPELTAERFIPHPFSSKEHPPRSKSGSCGGTLRDCEAGARLYKTGDLARYRPDGNVEFLGRIDHQIKLRGYRIEPREIEAALAEHPAVREAAVLAREDTTGDKRLVAYIVPQPAHAPTAGALRDFLKEKLPDYMVPAAFLLLDALPLTPSGKLDRRALPAPDQARPELERTYVAARDPVESSLVQIWERVLGIQPIGVQDHFFELGGHSLLAVRLFAQIEQTFGRKLPLAVLFQAPTVEELAHLLRQEGESPAWSCLVPIQPHGSRPPFFCVHAVGGNVLSYYDLGRYLGPDQPFYGLQAPGLDGNGVRPTRIEDLAAHYLREIRRLQPEGPYFLGGLSFGGMVAFEMAQQLHAQGQAVALLALLDTEGPGYPRYPPLGQRLRRHLWQLLQSDPGEALQYLWSRTKTLTARWQQRLQAWGFQLHLDWGDELPRSLRMVERANWQAVRDYVPHLYPGRVTLFRASEQPALCYPDPLSGWGGLAAGGVEVHEVPGNHLTIVEEPNVQILGRRLKACLYELQVRLKDKLTVFAVSLLTSPGLLFIDLVSNGRDFGV